MKIVIVSTAYPLRGGIAHYVSLLRKHLAERHEVSVITFKRQYPKFLFPGKSQDERGEVIGEQASPQVIDTLNPFTWFKAGRMAAARKPDLVIFKYWMPFFAPVFGTIARVARKRARCKVLFICDNVLPHEKTPVDRILTSWALKAGTCFVVQSKSVEKDLLSLFPSPVYKYVPHPVYEIFGQSVDKVEARSKLGIGNDENVALFFGYVRKYKGLHVLLDAVKRAATEIKLKVIVAGEFYEDEKPYRDHIEALGIGDLVRVFSDYIPNDQVSLYFSAADVVVLPYIDATQSGITQIAYNFDRPVIATDVGGLAETVIDGKTGLVVRPDSPDELAASIVKFFRERLAESLSKGVAEQKRLYSWDHLVNAIDELAGPARDITNS